MTHPKAHRATLSGRLLLAAALAVGFAAAELAASVVWSAPAFAQGKGGGGGNGGGGNGGGNGGGGHGGGNSGGNGNAGGQGHGHGKGGAPGQAAPGGEIEADSALTLSESGAIKPLAEIYAAAEQQFGGRVIGAKLIAESAGWTYDVRVVTEDGHVHSVSYDATTLSVTSLDGEPSE